MTEVTIGRIVQFFPNKNEMGLKLPNSMETAPAMVVQTFGGCVNLAVFTAESEPGLNPVKNAWSICHKDDAGKDQEGNPVGSYWDWLPRV